VDDPLNDIGTLRYEEREREERKESKEKK